MKSRRRIDNCNLCGSKSLESIYEVKNIPVHSSILLDSKTKARNFRQRDIELFLCNACGFIFNIIFDPTAIDYSSTFEESQHFSPTFDSFAHTLEQEIVDMGQLRGKTVLEIGCGRGEFLTELCAIGQCRGIGIDPGFRADRIVTEQSQRVEFYADYFGPKHYQLDPDIVICRHTLEHIDTVGDFILGVRSTIGNNHNTLTLFEVPDTTRILREGAFWDIYYEHCSYFTPGSHARLFSQQGFSIVELRRGFDDQYIIQYAVPTTGETNLEAFSLADDLETIQVLAKAFNSLASRKLEHWNTFIRDAARSAKVVLWGGGSKAVSFITTLGLDKEILAVVDINPYKQGYFLPGSGHEMIAPERLREAPPDLVLAMNPVYADEIRTTLSTLGLDAQVIPVR